MMSKSSFFKLMRENTKQRLWTVALIALILFFAFPVQTALSISRALDPEQMTNLDQAKALLLAEERIRSHFVEWCSIQNGFLIFLLGVFAVICGISGFSYLQSRKKTDFYHCMPVKRETWFAVVALDGVLYVAVPYLVFLLISAVMVQVKAGSLSWGAVLGGYALHMSFFLLLYVTVVTAVILTGHLVVSVLGTLVFFLWGPGVLMLMEGYFQTYYVTYCGNDATLLALLKRSSPAALYVATAGADNPAALAFWALAAAVLVTGIAVALYRIRPSEAAGRAMAFRISQPIIKVLLVVPSALLGSLMFRSLMGKDSWGIFGLLCGLLISYCVIEIIYNFDFKRLFAHKRQLLLCGAVSAVILAFFRFDISGYDSYLPPQSRLASVGIYNSQMEPNAIGGYHVKPVLRENSNGDVYFVNWYYDSSEEVADRMELHSFEAIETVARRGIADAARQREENLTSRTVSFQSQETEDGQWGSVVMAYHLKSGKTVLRRYMTNLSAVSGELDSLYDETEYKTAMYPVLSLKPEELAGVNYQEYGDYRHVSFSSQEQMEELLSVYQKELAELTAAVRRRESPVAAIQFKTKEMQEMIDRLRASGGNYTSFNGYLYYPIYPSFTGTIRLLDGCGISVGNFLTEENVERIVLDYEDAALSYMAADGASAEVSGNEEIPRRLTVTEKDRIRQLLDASYSYDMGLYDKMNPKYQGVGVLAYVLMEQEETDAASDGLDELEKPEMAEEFYDAGNGEEYMTFRLVLDYDRVPDFVKQEFHLTEETMAKRRSEAY